MNDMGELSQQETEIAATVALDRDLIFEDEAQLVIGDRCLSLSIAVYGRWREGVGETVDDEGDGDGFDIERVMLGSGPDARDITAMVTDYLDVFDEIAKEST